MNFLSMLLGGLSGGGGPSASLLAGPDPWTNAIGAEAGGVPLPRPRPKEPPTPNLANEFLTPRGEGDDNPAHGLSGFGSPIGGAAQMEGGMQTPRPPATGGFLHSILGGGSSGQAGGQPQQITGPMAQPQGGGRFVSLSGSSSQDEPGGLLTALLGDRIGNFDLRRFTAALGSGLAGGRPGESGWSAFGRGMGMALQGGDRYDTQRRDRRMKEEDLRYKRQNEDRKFESSDRLNRARSGYYETMAKDPSRQGYAKARPAPDRLLQAENIKQAITRNVFRSFGLDRLNPRDEGYEEKRQAAEAEAQRRIKIFEDELNRSGAFVNGRQGSNEPQVVPNGPDNQPNTPAPDQRPSPQSVKESKDPNQGKSATNPFRPLTMDDFRQLPIGAYYVNPKDGRVLRKTKQPE